MSSLVSLIVLVTECVGLAIKLAELAILIKKPKK